MVTLSSTPLVDEIVGAARLLRDADNPTVRRAVFINRDLTKEEGGRRKQRFSKDLNRTLLQIILNLIRSMTIDMI